MAIWGKTSGSESRPKSLPNDSNSTSPENLLLQQVKDG